MADEGDKEDLVNLDGISDSHYPHAAARSSFQLNDKFSTFNHLVPGEPVPIAHDA